MRTAIHVSLAVLLLAACGPRVAPAPQAVNDPFEGANRQVHAFNKGLDANLVRPLTQRLSGGDGGSDAAAGSPLDVVTNIGSNLALPGKVVNHMLQGRPGPAIRNSLRFVVNSTLGLGGLHDPAGAEFALTEIDTDFGETLYRWGLPEGPYVELPLLGPSTSRRAVGRVVDIVIDPVDGWLEDDAARAAWTVRLASKAGERSRFGDTVDSVLYDSADSYAQTRLIYLMHRRHELGQEGESDDPYVIDPYESGTTADEFAIDPYEE